MTGADFALAFGFGVVSSLHCAQMCGPIVLSYSVASCNIPLDPARLNRRPGQPANSKRRNWRLSRFASARAADHAAYNGGRILTYSILGAIAGSAGGAVGLAGRLAGIGQAAAISAGVLMVAAGIVMLGLVPRSSLVKIGASGISGWLSRTAGQLLRSRSTTSRFVLGLVLGLLPCGLVYAALLKAMATAAALSGALSMLAFGLGTSGTLVAIGGFSSALGLRFGRWTNRIAAACVILVGVWVAWRGFAVAPQPGCALHGRS